jgi:hypothetical protein
MNQAWIISVVAKPDFRDQAGSMKVVRHEHALFGYIAGRLCTPKDVRLVRTP